jgi:hypothetical protein
MITQFARFYHSVRFAQRLLALRNLPGKFDESRSRLWLEHFANFKVSSPHHVNHVRELTTEEKSSETTSGGIPAVSNRRHRRLVQGRLPR